MNHSLLLLFLMMVVGAGNCCANDETSDAKNRSDLFKIAEPYLRKLEKNIEQHGIRNLRPFHEMGAALVWAKNDENYNGEFYEVRVSYRLNYLQKTYTSERFVPYILFHIGSPLTGASKDYLNWNFEGRYKPELNALVSMLVKEKQNLPHYSYQLPQDQPWIIKKKIRLDDCTVCTMYNDWEGIDCKVYLSGLAPLQKEGQSDITTHSEEVEVVKDAMQNSSPGLETDSITGVESEIQKLNQEIETEDSSEISSK